MSVTEVRIYRVSNSVDTTAQMELKVLTTNEKMFVISELHITSSYQTLIDSEISSSDFSRMRFKVGDTITEKDLLDYVQSPDSLVLTLTRLDTDKSVEIYPFIPAEINEVTLTEDGWIVVVGEGFIPGTQLFINDEQVLINNIINEIVIHVINNDIVDDAGDYDFKVVNDNGESDEFTYTVD